MKIYTAVCLFMIASSAQAKVYFHVGNNCEDEYFSRIGGQVEDLKQLHYTYPCTETISFGKDQQMEKEVETTCTRNFNDILKSIEITEDEEVELFKHTGFRGSSEYFSGKGCHPIQDLWNEGSSLKIRK